MLDQVRIVLVETSHSGNIGSAARAMKTMGLCRLYLVAPKAEVDGHSIALAAGASDILRDAVICDDLQQAIGDCSLVVGTSARNRSQSWPQLDARTAGTKLAEEANCGSVALVFGRENHGLNNDELQQCHYHVSIPANPEYSSLNLAQAVQLLCYEIRMAALIQVPVEASPLSTRASAEQLEACYQHLERALIHSQFLNADNPSAVMTKLRRLFNRARPEAQEVNILRGICTSIERLDNVNRAHIFPKKTS